MRDLMFLLQRYKFIYHDFFKTTFRINLKNNKNMLDYEFLSAFIGIGIGWSLIQFCVVLCAFMVLLLTWGSFVNVDLDVRTGRGAYSYTYLGDDLIEPVENFQFSCGISQKLL